MENAKIHNHTDKRGNNKQRAESRLSLEIEIRGV